MWIRKNSNDEKELNEVNCIKKLKPKKGEQKKTTHYIIETKSSDSGSVLGIS